MLAPIAQRQQIMLKNVFMRNKSYIGSIYFLCQFLQLCYFNEDCAISIFMHGSFRANDDDDDEQKP